MLGLRVGLLDHVVLSKTHIGSEGSVWYPSARLACGNLLHHAVDLLEGKTLGLWDEEVCKGDGYNAERAIHEEDLHTHVGLILVHEVWGDNGHDAVPEPVGGGGETNTTGSDWEREDLADNDPGTWSPGGGEHEDVEANECDHGRGGRCGITTIILLFSGGETNGSDNELADNHSGSTNDQKVASTETLNHPECEWGGADVDKGGDE